MEYKMEDLLLLTSKLTDKYTSKESSSVPYETARQLMAAVVYCLDENFTGTSREIADQGQLPETAVLYQRGYDLVLDKVYQAKEVYEKIIADFDDYHCKSYRQTILDGIPAFFLKYDPRFNPQDHLLTLDYPTMISWEKLSGIDLILKYLRGIRCEQMLLSRFRRDAIIEFLESILSEYEDLLLDNICYLVLFQAIGCMIADKPVDRLELTGEDWQLIRQYFDGSDKNTAQIKVSGIIKLFLKHLAIDPDYFTAAAADYAVRFINLQDGLMR